MKKSFILSFILFTLCFHVFSSNISSNAVTGNWNSTTSWVGGVVPGTNDTVIIVNGSNITLNANATVYKMRISSGGIFNLSSNKLKLNGNGADNGSMSIYGTLNLNTGILELTGDFYTGSSTYQGTFNANTGTVNFNGNVHQQIYGETIPEFYNLTTSNTNNSLQMGVTGHSVNTVIKGNFVANGVFNRNSDNNYPAKVTFSGNTTLSGIYSFFLQHVVIDAGATLNATNKTIYLYGTWTNNGTFICGTSTLWFVYDPNHPTHPDQTVSNMSASSNPFYNIYINKTTGTVTPIVNPNDALNPMGHLWVNGSFTVNNGTWINGDRQLWVKKDFLVNSGTYNAGLGRLILNGSTQQLLKTNTSNLYKFTVDNSSGGVLLVSDVNVANELVLTNGAIYTTESYQLYVSNSATNAIPTYSASSFVVGRLRREVVSGASNYVFPIGPMNITPLKYRPVTYEQTSSGSAANISMIEDIIPVNANLANWYIRIGSNTGNPAGNLLFSYNLSQDFPTGVNECAFSVVRGTTPPPANWNYILTTATGATGGNSGSIRATIPASLVPNAFIIGEPIPQLNNVSICSNNSIALSVVSPTGSTNFNWYNAPSGGTLLHPNSASYTTPVLNSTTTYYVANVNSTTSCISNYRTPVIVTVGSSSSVNIIPNGPTSICGNGSVILDAGNMYASYLWQNNSTAETITATTAGLYTVHVSDANGCTGSGSINVSITPLPGNATTVNGPSTLCVGSNATFTTPTVANATGYQWVVPNGISIVSGQGTNTINIVVSSNVSGNISVSPSNSCGNGNSTSILVTVSDAPDNPLSISGPNSVCAGEIATYTIPYVTGATGYQWDVPSTTSIVSGNGTNSISLDWGSATTGTISVTPYNSCGNSIPSSIYVTVSQLPPSVTGNINGPLFVCHGDMTNYYITPVNNATGYIWEVPLGISIAGGQNTNTITVDWQFATSGFIKVIPTNGCGLGVTDSIFVVSQESPDAPVISDTIYVCQVDTIRLGVPPVLNVTFNWWDSETGGQMIATGDTVNLYNLSDNTSIWVEAVGASGCSNPGGREEVRIVVFPHQFISLTSDLIDNSALLGQAITFTAMPSQYHIYDYFVNTLISQSSNSNIYITNSLSNNDVVSVVATDANGCIYDADSIQIKIKPIPNAFTPNGDGINDVFMKNYDLSILNRWGQTLYQGREGWDGKYKGEQITSGTYFYIITYLGLKGEIISVNGSVELSR